MTNFYPLPLNETHDPDLKSWVESANGHPDFPIQNLPYGIFSVGREARRVGVAIGDYVLDVSALDGVFAPEVQDAFMQPTLNRFMGLGRACWQDTRLRLSELLRDDFPSPFESSPHLHHQSDVQMHLPFQVGDYTDFYAGIHHATRVGSLFRPDNPLMPNYKHVPIGYHGRSSSIVVSGTPITRPAGQILPDPAQPPIFAPSRRLDYELELGFVVSGGNDLGEPISIEQAREHLFGVVLLNDWSARDIQAWEYQPLGPFLSKNFATSISPWVVTFEALAPFRTAAFVRPPGDPSPLLYLQDERDRMLGGLDIHLTVSLQTQSMTEPQQISQSSATDLYWTPAQLLAHHTCGGCNLRPGDLLGSGTISGAAQQNAGCLLEITMGGKDPLPLASGETRCFLEDGDQVVLQGWCEKEGFARIGFGNCSGQVLPARQIEAAQTVEQ
ncbi:fumarylacetoacetase [Deinococcus cellulosilyticus]|uniref:fumarylacetoacetase n=1 Tax=Deinococcus cellulosilyticus (strain DSM 18568 / NBRC 106333 / KACC 11606 / 5516J-15) TaxID=1223518 RepID=A0A511MXY2_DEIC1|nr:fumarylacetoacetase [Deinococcus cellulosilyticus]GEM45148.1 fumarylacetoacetase [Deinococcus cellulosilyticus NBRC 106333 = KACC 11606]